MTEYFSKHIPATIDGYDCPLVFEYSKHDPWAVTLTVRGVRWIVSRDVLDQAFVNPGTTAGEGDFQATCRGLFTVLVLDTDTGNAVVDVDSNALQDAIVETVEVVAFGKERIDWDREIQHWAEPWTGGPE